MFENRVQYSYVVRREVRHELSKTPRCISTSGVRLRAASNYTANHVHLKDKKAIYEEQNFSKGEHEIGRYNN
jgi:hypothetical protein